MSTGQHVDIKHLHPFWTSCLVYIPPETRNGKLGQDRSYPAFMVGYVFTSVEFKQYYVVRNYGKGVHGKFRLSKVVVFDDYQHYLERNIDDYPLDPDFVLDGTPDADPLELAPASLTRLCKTLHHGIYHRQRLCHLTLRRSTQLFSTPVRNLMLCTGTTSEASTSFTSTQPTSH